MMKYFVGCQKQLFDYTGYALGNKAHFLSLRKPSTNVI